MATSMGHKFDDPSDQNLTLHEMFRVVGDQLLPRDVRVLKFLYTGVFPDDLRAKIDDGYTFFLALERIGRVDTSNFKYIINVLRIIVRQDLIPLVTLRRRKTVEPDPVDLYLEETVRVSSGKRKSPDVVGDAGGGSPLGQPGTSTNDLDGTATTLRKDPDPDRGCVSPALISAVRPSTTTPTTSPCSSSLSPPEAKRRRSMRRRTTVCAATSSVTSPTAPATSVESVSVTSLAPGGTASVTSSPMASMTSSSLRVEHESREHQEIRKKVTCDIRLRVRAEYCHHESALQGNVFSNKPELLERQFEKLMQANTILKSRDLGSIICDIKFSELTYLDAFWRDYINGSLLEALKGVFITESLKQAVGHEAIKLLVNVDEDDYEAGRKQLLRNLQE